MYLLEELGQFKGSHVEHDVESQRLELVASDCHVSEPVVITPSDHRVDGRIFVIGVNGEVLQLGAQEGNDRVGGSTAECGIVELECCDTREDRAESESSFQSFSWLRMLS